MERFANELLEKIFSYLDDESLNVVERVCVKWSQIVVARVWFPRVAAFLRQNDFLQFKLKSVGWSPKCSHENYLLNRRLYRKLLSDWPNEKCKVDEAVILCGQSREVNVCLKQNILNFRKISNYYIFCHIMFWGLAKNVPH